MTIDLNNAELDRLNELMALTPPPLAPLDAVMIDGYLAGVAVQPHIIPIADWVKGVFDVEGRPLPEPLDAAWLAQCRALLERRFVVINTDIAEQGWFDPVMVDAEHAPPISEYETPLTDAALTLAPWLAGFGLALERYPQLRHDADDTVAQTLARIDTLAALPDPKTAVQALVDAVVTLWFETEATRLHVQTIRRGTPKVGRNDPCPCGSGRKYKACHGASV